MKLPLSPSIPAACAAKSIGCSPLSGNIIVLERRKATRYLCMLLMGLGSGLASQAESVVASYDFTGGSLSSSDVDSGSVASTLGGMPAPNVTASPDRIAYAAADSPTTWSASTGYASFTLTPGSSALNFTSLVFDYGYQNITTGGNYALRVFTSLTGFSSESDAIYFSGVTSSSTGNVTPSTVSVDLSSIGGLQSVATPVEFRFYFTDGHSALSRYHLVDNIVLSANTAMVPEPSVTATIAGALVLALAGMHRRKRI